MLETRQAALIKAGIRLARQHPDKIDALLNCKSAEEMWRLLELGK